MSLAQRRLVLPTGIELDLWEGGTGEPILFLHGFPESHRTWRHQLADLSRDHRVVAPDQRGYARSGKPAQVEDYAVDKLVGDVIALADALGIGRFTLVGHDWGGAVAWATAIGRPDRVSRLVIVNAPHPLIFQRTLIDDPAQRAASQYIRLFREPDIVERVEAMRPSGLFDRILAPFVSHISDEDRAAYLDEWSQPGAIAGMLNWYRAAGFVVPAPGESVERPAFLDRPFPPVMMPTLVVWGTRDTALLPCQLEGLDALVPDLRLVKVDAGHFVPWEAPDALTAAIRDFLAG